MAHLAQKLNLCNLHFDLQKSPRFVLVAQNGHPKTRHSTEISTFYYAKGAKRWPHTPEPSFCLSDLDLVAQLAENTHTPQPAALMRFDFL